MRVIMQTLESRDIQSTQAVELLNHALRIEYAGITHLPVLHSVVQEVHIRQCISLLIDESTMHAVSLAATIRALGGSPVWKVWTPSDRGSLERLFEIQLAREKICLNLYKKAAQLLNGSRLADKCAYLAEDKNRHIEIVEHILAALADRNKVVSAATTS